MKDNKYNNKKLLLIAPLFFGYYKEILKEAENMGMEADYICDAPSNTNLSKAVARINKSFIKGATRKYYEKNVYPVVCAKQYDYVLLVAGMTFAFFPNMVREIRECQKKARFVMYQWDSEENLPYSTHIHKYFDDIYTFDRIDSENDSKYKFLPLFYTRLYEKASESNEKAEYDCSYVGTAHPQKYKDINDISEAVKEKLPRQFIYHYMPSRLKYVFHKLTAPEYKGASISEFEYEKLTGNEILRIFEQSDCILDSPQKGQTGLTIRTIECLGAKKKLITTNADIVNYDFYNKNNILVFDGEINEKSSFFTTDYEELPDEIYRKYSLRSWLGTMLLGVVEEVKL